MPVSNKTATIVGAGLVGSLWAVYLKNAGYKVSIFERRPDMRKATTSAGKSINLATSFRGWKALDQVGIGDEMRKIAIPMYGRTMHHVNGTTTYQPYGNNNQAIYSVARGAINAKLMDIAEDSTHAAIHFNHECINADTQQGLLTFKNTQTGQLITHQDDLIFATDGAFSAVRYNGLQKLDQFNYSQTYIPDGYREILLPANPDGSYPLAKETLHIWPRERFMLIALPNFDGSFTCTLFMPFEGHQYCFNNLTDKAKVEAFFEAVFPDFYRLMPQVADAWEDHPLSSLAIIRCYPWTHGKVALMGDAAHATVPFFGQGMNCGFEDCTVLDALIDQHNGDWSKILPDYQLARKPNSDAIADLAVMNFVEMRDLVGSQKFLLQKKIEARIHEKHPSQWLPLYSQVTFSSIPYSEALANGQRQQAIMQNVMALPDIEKRWDTPEVESMILKAIS